MHHLARTEPGTVMFNKKCICNVHFQLAIFFVLSIDDPGTPILDSEEEKKNWNILWLMFDWNWKLFHSNVTKLARSVRFDLLWFDFSFSIFKLNFWFLFAELLLISECSYPTQLAIWFNYGNCSCCCKSCWKIKTIDKWWCLNMEFNTRSTNNDRKKKRRIQALMLNEKFPRKYPPNALLFQRQY